MKLAISGKGGVGKTTLAAGGAVAVFGGALGFSDDLRARLGMRG